MLPKAAYGIFVLILVLVITIDVSAKSIVVVKGGAVSSLQAAIAMSESGDTIIIKAGTYYESRIEIDKSIVLIGEGFPVIDGGGKDEVLTVTADSVWIEGLQIQNIQANYIEDVAAIKVKKSKQVTIHNNRILDTFFGVYLEHSSDVLVSKNHIVSQSKLEMSSGNAIHLWYCKRIKIIDNYVSGHRDGIYLEFVENSTVQGNESNANVRYGLHFMFSNHDEYSDNIFRNNGAGVAVMFSNHIKMQDNQFLENWGEAAYGLLLKEIYDATIVNNDFIKNCTAIFVEGSTRIEYRSNLFRDNGWALKISGGCLENKVHKNNFISNSFDVAFHGAKNESSFDGNFWASYSGYDLDKDQIGDIPYRPVKLFNFIVQQTPEAIVLLRSLFVDIVNFAERINPLYTPKNIIDHQPLMQPYHD